MYKCIFINQINSRLAITLIRVLVPRKNYCLLSSSFTVLFQMLFPTSPTVEYPILLFNLTRPPLLLPFLHFEGLAWYIISRNCFCESSFFSANSCCFLVSSLSSALQIFRSSSKSLSLTSKILKVLFPWRDVPLPPFWWTWSISYCTMPRYMFLFTAPESYYVLPHTLRC